MKKNSHKLQLAKETLRRLNSAVLQDAAGGVSARVACSDACTTSLIDSEGCSPFPSYAQCNMTGRCI